MMVAMMLPSVFPTLLLYRTVAGSRGRFGFRVVPIAVFGAGYFLIWSLMGVAVHLGGGLLGPIPADWRRGAVAGALLVAGVYQLTRLKAWCLGHCRSPLHFLQAHWRDGVVGAVRMGAHHGLYCVGCCWGLMVALIALGMMRPLWMTAIAAAIFAEKIIPRGNRLAPVFGAALLALGAAVALGLVPLPTPMPMGGMHGQTG